MTVWYRYEDRLTDSASPDLDAADFGVTWDGDPISLKITLREYPVRSETPRTVLLGGQHLDKPKRVLKNARRRFAYPTTELALESYRRRKVVQRSIARETIKRADEALRQVDAMMADERDAT